MEPDDENYDLFMELFGKIIKVYEDTELTWYCQKTGEIVIP